MLLSDCEPILTTFNKPQRSEMMLSTNSSLRLVRNQTKPSETYHQDEPIQTMTLMNLPTKNAESSNQRCPGSTVKKRPDKLVTKTVRNPAGSLDSSLAITRSSDSGSKTQEQHHSVFPPLNGTTSSRDKLSTSMQCSHHCTIFLLLKRTLDRWECNRLLSYPIIAARISKINNEPAQS